MTDEQFKVISILIRSSGGKAEQAAYRVLVGGEVGKIVADDLQMAPQSVSQAAGRFKKAAALIKGVDWLL